MIVHEKYEWSDIWWDCADETSLDRVLLIGDSISRGYTQPVIELLKDVVHVDRLANSRGINDPALTREITYVLGEFRYKAIHFNNGLHGFHIPDDVYGSQLAQLVDVLGHYGQGAKLIWASSTPVTLAGDASTLDPINNAIVLRRNEIAAAIMRDSNIPINDLYSVMVDRPELSAGDGYHYTSEGYEVLGKRVAARIS